VIKKPRERGGREKYNQKGCNARKTNTQTNKRGLLVVDKKWQQSTAQRDIDVSVGATVHAFADKSYIACVLNEVVILKCSSRAKMHSRVNFGDSI